MTSFLPRESQVEDRPAGALQAERGGLELRAERVERTEVLVDRGSQLTGGLVAALGGEVLPEDRVVDVTTEMEREVLLQQVDVAEGLLVAGLLELLESLVDAGDVGRVVLGVVKLHDLARNVRIQCAVVVRQIRKCVDSHASSSGSGARRALNVRCLCACNTQSVSRVPARNGGAHPWSRRRVRPGACGADVLVCLWQVRATSDGRGGTSGRAHHHGPQRPELRPAAAGAGVPVARARARRRTVWPCWC